jgi:AraC-like DNA-binding protein
MTRILAEWDYTTTAAESAVVPPDGCVDLIIVKPRSAKPHWFLSELQAGSNSVCLKPDLEMYGFRLRPGTQVNQHLLDHVLVDLNSLERVREYLGEACSGCANIDQAIAALSRSEFTVSQAARDLGVSIRALQRLFSKADLPSPGFWRALARARLAVVNLQSQTNLVDQAMESGFSDQAHMTREFVRWFGATPAQMLRNQDLQHAIRQSGLAT